MVEMGATRFDCVPLVQVPFDPAARLCPKAPSVLRLSSRTASADPGPHAAKSMGVPALRFASAGMTGQRLSPLPLGEGWG